MSYAVSYVRTSVSLDAATIDSLDTLSKRWAVSKAEVMRRAIRRLQQDSDAEDKRPTPLESMEWLQHNGGLSVSEGGDFKAEIQAERQAKRNWWE